MTMLDDSAENRRLHERLRTQNARRALADAGRKLGARNPERLHRMVEWDALAFDADDALVNADEVVAELASTDSYLFASLAEESPEVRQAGQPEAPREWAVNQALRAALPVPVPTDPAKASREIGDALRAVTGRGGRGRQV